MGLNDLSKQIIFNHEYELKPNLPAINYAEYGMAALNHPGDSDEEQCVICKSDKVKQANSNLTNNKTNIPEKQ